MKKITHLLFMIAIPTTTLRLLSTLLFLGFLSIAHGDTSVRQHSTADATRLKHFNDKSKLMLAGYDAVSYHSKAGPSKGSATHQANYKGVVYYFADAANLATFQSNPAKYEPLYGGWCGWAMLSGDKTKVNPKTFKVIDGHLVLFYNGAFGNTLKKWNKRAVSEGDAKLVDLADDAWEKILASN